MKVPDIDVCGVSAVLQSFRVDCSFSVRFSPHYFACFKVRGVMWGRAAGQRGVHSTDGCILISDCW